MQTKISSVSKQTIFLNRLFLIKGNEATSQHAEIFSHLCCAPMTYTFAVCICALIMCDRVFLCKV